MQTDTETYMELCEDMIIVAFVLHWIHLAALALVMHSCTLGLSPAAALDSLPPPSGDAPPSG